MVKCFEKARSIYRLYKRFIVLCWCEKLAKEAKAKLRIDQTTMDCNFFQSGEMKEIISTGEIALTITGLVPWPTSR